MSNTGKAKIEKTSYDLKVKYGVLESALSMVQHCDLVFHSIIQSLRYMLTLNVLYSQLEKNRAEQLEKFYPNLICTQSLGHVSNLYPLHVDLLSCIH